jgi:hypothetical protein
MLNIKSGRRGVVCPISAGSEDQTLGPSSAPVATLWPTTGYFRSALRNGHRPTGSACLKGANMRHQPHMSDFRLMKFFLLRGTGVDFCHAAAILAGDDEAVIIKP